MREHTHNDQLGANNDTPAAHARLLSALQHASLVRAEFQAKSFVEFKKINDVC